LSKGMRRRNVLLVNVFSAIATLVAAVLTYWIGSEETLPVGVSLGLSAGFLLYIALSDVIPAIHSSKDRRRSFAVQAILLFIGAVVVGVLTTYAHQFLDSSH